MTPGRPAMRRLGAILFAHPAPGDRLSIRVQCALCVITFPIVHWALANAPFGRLPEAVQGSWEQVEYWLGEVGAWPGGPENWVDTGLLASVAAIAIFAQFLLLFLLASLLSLRLLPLAILMHAAWRTSVVALVFVPPMTATLLALVPLGAYYPTTPNFGGPALPAHPLVILGLPHLFILSHGAAVAVVLVRTRRARRWRPVCPECGYELFRCTAPRCAECGVAFPTTSRVYRRWAILRLPWDALRRTSAIRDYAVTAARIVLCPRAAAWRLVIPDRFGRALRWALAHFLIALAVLMMMRFLREAVWLALYVTGTADERRRMSGEWGGWPLLTWSVLGWPLLANAIALLMMPAIGVGLSWLIPFRHPAARLAGIKWSLYATVVPFSLLVGCAAAYGALLPRYATVRSGLLEPGIAWPHHAILAAGFVLYALRWASGLSAHPYQRRTWLWFVAFVAAYEIACLLLYFVILPPWVLVTLL